ncbi:hypothetical protein GCM10027187_36260 [Streptosporangium sandarakinum]
MRPEPGAPAPTARSITRVRIRGDDEHRHRPAVRLPTGKGPRFLPTGGNGSGTAR